MTTGSEKPGAKDNGNRPSPPPPSALPAKRIAGIDYGTVRVGIAIGDLEVRMASPYENYTRRSERLDAQYFSQLAQQERLARWVVGLPVHLSGEESQKSYEARQFGAWLTHQTGLPVDFFDERYTSSQAEAMLQSANLTKKKRKARLDQLAAQIMLTAYLESGARGNDNPGGLD